MANRHNRQSGIIKAGELTMPVHILGAGGIGSWTVLLLAKMGCSNIIVYDHDKVEDHNVASQFFKEEQLDKYKVDALKDNVLEQTGVEIETTTDIKEEEQIKDGLIIMALDSMGERIRLGNIYKDREIFIIDGRMGGLVFEVYNVFSHNYLETTVPPENVDPERCTERAICFNCAGIASIVANYVRQYAKGDLSFQGEFIFDYSSMTMLKKNHLEPPITQATLETLDSQLDAILDSDND